MKVWEKVEIFFSTKFNYVLNKIKLLVILLFTGLFVCSLLVAPDIGPLTKPEHFIASDHPEL